MHHDPREREMENGEPAHKPQSQVPGRALTSPHPPGFLLALGNGSPSRSRSRTPPLLD
eukprot:CAMPEP_0118979974 /NCGR_PEP_ID=MMETSP1173-20130426/27194_1 /TAXON_ID=1034831 /ORGANISM="Rhizochromulina marina cf, Strain CCMP1243" /LENGTH=57 /DNA_ID=CAMNT_0006930277 /DNA_START=103 /DNA_END=273 /DNA_ORIENTATION=+